MWVVFHNSTVLLPPVLQGVWHLLARLAMPGWIGVQLFFTLSGFLITGGLLATRDAKHCIGAFYARRALRILPLYYSVLTLLLMVGPQLRWGPPQWRPTLAEQLSLWFFIVNWTHAPYGFGHFWSLAVEEQVYAFWPLVVVRFGSGRLPAVLIGMAVISMLTRVIMVLNGATGWTVYASTISRLDAFALGGIGACLLQEPRARVWLFSRLSTGLVALLGLASIGAAISKAYDPEAIRCQMVGYTVLALGGAILVTGAAAGDLRPGGMVVTRLLTWSFLRSIGKYSYGIYVFHQLINKLIGEPWLISVFGEHPGASVVYAYSLGIGILSFVLAYTSYHVLEKHFLALKGRLAPNVAARLTHSNGD